jgi:hypothetical protein
LKKKELATIPWNHAKFRVMELPEFRIMEKPEFCRIPGKQREHPSMRGAYILFLIRMGASLAHTFS